uniref:Uncharacterized protein n=1 Tax=Arundo donax TaxID=35708 RepID=A0A0A9H6E9_ARUDO
MASTPSRRSSGASSAA